MSARPEEIPAAEGSRFEVSGTLFLYPSSGVYQMGMTCFTEDPNCKPAVTLTGVNPAQADHLLNPQSPNQRVRWSPDTVVVRGTLRGGKMAVETMWCARSGHGCPVY